MFLKTSQNKNKNITLVFKLGVRILRGPSKEMAKLEYSVKEKDSKRGVKQKSMDSSSQNGSANSCWTEEGNAFA